MAQATQAGSGAEIVAPSFGEAVAVWAKLGFLSFGGPAGQIALMHRFLVDEKGWIEERHFLPALNFCMLLPGPEAMQLATYIGWRLHGVKGGLAAGLLFVIPGALVVLLLSALYAAFGQVPAIEAVFVGIKAAVLAIVLEALIKVSRRALHSRTDVAIAIAAFVGIFLLALPFPVIILAAAVVGFAGTRRSAKSALEPATNPVALADTVRTAAIWLGIWILPLLALALVVGSDHVLAQLALLFSKLAVVTFGGAYAVLAYMAQAAVDTHGWLAANEMLDGLGLAETTPGPLILVTEFVGFLAAYRMEGGIPLVSGMLGAFVALWATFAPCFLWIFAGAPYVDRINADPRLRSALQAVTAAVVGVIFNLAVWFALHVVFANVLSQQFGPVRLLVPQIGSINPVAFALTLLAIALLFVVRTGVISTLLICGAAALAWHWGAAAL